MELYHATNRGVDGRDIFMDSSDYARFVHDLFEFNDTSPSGTYRQRSMFGRRTSEHRKPLVRIHGWVLMRNHYHLLLSELVPDGSMLFLKKLNGGYAKYFNERYSRKGALFQGKTRKVPVREHAHFLYVLHYIHLNPLDYCNGAEHWRERDKGSVLSVRAALIYLKEYRWSSFLDYVGVKNFPSIITTDVFSSAPQQYEKDICDFLKDREAYESIEPIKLEIDL